MKSEDFSLIYKLSNEYAESLDIDDLRYEFAKNLLNQNTKTAKQKDGSQYENYGLEMTPSILLSSFFQSRKLESFNNCKNFSKDCLLTCLYFSGFQANIMFSESIFLDGKLSPTMCKRIRRNVLYALDPEFFFSVLSLEIDFLVKKCLKLGKKARFRLNVFQDIDFSKFIAKKKNAFFYDYTRIWERKSTKNHHLTFSVSEKTPIPLILEKLESGENVSVIFEGKTLPSEYLDYRVIDGDIDDNRHLDKNGVVIGLRRKTTLKRKEKNVSV